MTLLTFFNVNTIAFTVLGYPMSYIEFFGTIFTGWSVYLAAKNKITTWPISLLGIVLYGFLFYQIQLYSDLFEQIYYFVTSFWGWYLWTHPKNKEKNSELSVTSNSLSTNIIYIVLIFALTQLLSLFMSNIHLIFPKLFPVAASFPWMDSFTTIMSFVATIYLAKRKIENWYLWIIVDIIGVWLYFQKGVVFLSLLYFAFLINAFYGLAKWRRELKTNEEKV